MLVSGRDIANRTDDFEKIAGSHSLRAWQWEVLLALDWRTPLGEIARKLGLEMPVVAELVAWFDEQGLTAIRTVSFEEYRQAKAAEKPLVRAEEPSSNGVKPAPAPKASAPGPAGSIGFKIR
jgi:hypothetical protein